ncbi:YeeE/YedE family protein [Sphingomonas oligophenolica]|uniref:YeeE/YedE family protein n=1 Tax=Sphingomonas oligophenolica TaxID=301154 RepID=A0A502C1G0_9SPHN|nr:YeeE/YedE thiosulfate transporter family protein [Sphingomonas oligophenolica]TPG06580.1 YeeE/YedE family protein [Sphingomonas oligophenolica]
MIDPASLVHGLIGGLMIGVAAAAMLLGAGRIAGVSGLAARAAGISDAGAPRLIAAAFVIGLPLGAWLVSAVLGRIETRFPSSILTLAVGGFIVGIGTRLGSGCTSGHGVCGVSRLSPRSLAATAIFMAAGITTVTAMRWLGVSW